MRELTSEEMTDVSGGAVPSYLVAINPRFGGPHPLPPRPVVDPFAGGPHPLPPRFVLR